MHINQKKLFRSAFKYSLFSILFLSTLYSFSQTGVWSSFGAEEVSITSVTPGIGCFGSTVTITGTNLTGATEVNFGGTAAKSFTVVSSETITAIINKGATGNVSITTPLGTAVYNGFVYVNAAIPSIIISASSVNICSGTSVTFTATVDNGGANPIYTWKVNGVAVRSNSNTYSSSALNNNDNITCELTSNAPCATTADVTSNSIQMTVRSLPAVSISGDTCTGSVLTVTTNVTPSSLAWTLNSSTQVSNQQPGINPNATTVAGGNGAGAGANQFNNPNRFFLDKAGNMYIADMSNSRVQKWAPGAASGVTVAGGNGIGSAANQFNRPTSVAMDSKGNLYVTDQDNGRIQKWAPGATTGTSFSRVVYSPTSIFIDASDNVYVSEQDAARVTKLPATTRNNVEGTAVAGNVGESSIPQALNGPTGIFVDSAGNVYVCDTNNDRVQKWAPYSQIGVTVAGGNGHGSAANQLANPLGVFVDKNGNIYVADYNNARVQKWAPGATSGITVAGGNGLGDAPNQLNRPQGIWLDTNGDLWVSDFYNNRVQKFSNSLNNTYTTLAAGNYTVTVTSSNGCSATSNAIKVVPAKTPQVSITTDSTTICPGTYVTFTALPQNGGSNPLYQWKINDVNTGQNSNKNSFSSATLQSGDVVSCEITSNATSCLTAKTATSNTIAMNVYSPGAASITIGATDTIICSGSTLNFTASPVNGGANPIYQWKVNGINRGIANTNPFFSTADSKDGDVVSCEMTSSENLCPAALTASSNNILVRVITAPVMSVMVVASDTGICTGSTVNFTAVAVNAGTNPVYSWKINNTSTGTNNNVYSDNSLKSGDVVKVSVTSNMQCAASPVSSNSITMTVDEIPTIITRPDTVIFAGGSIRLNTTVTGNINTYRWSPSANIDNYTIASPLATPIETTTYRLLVTTPGGCTANGDVTISTITEVTIPNVFSPNNDGINDFWNITGLSSYTECTVEVFNRYGQPVFRSGNYSRPWNGSHASSPLPAGTYYYIIKSKRLGTKSGAVTILR